MIISNSFLNIDNEDMDNIRNWLIKNITIELSNIIRPCYLPKINRFLKDFIFVLNNPEKDDIKNFFLQFDPKYRKFEILSDPFTNLIMMLMVESGKRKNKDVLKLCFLFLGIKFYASLLHRFFPKFCSENVWKDTLNSISSRNLIRNKGSMSDFVRYISEEIIRKYSHLFNEKGIDETSFILSVMELRHRISQSLKSFSRKYYDTIKTKSINKDGATDEEASEEDKIYKIREIIYNACNSAEIDEKALIEAFRKSNIKIEISRYIIKELLSPEYIQNWLFIINLYLKLASLNSICQEKSIIYYINIIADGKAKIGNYNLKKEIENMYLKTESNLIYTNLNNRNVIKMIIAYILNHLRRRLC